MGRELRFGWENAQLFLALKNNHSVFVPALIELTPVFFDPLQLNMMRGVPDSGSVIQEEGLIRGVDVGILYKLNGFVGQVDIQMVAFLRRFWHGNRVIVVGQVGEPLVGIATHETVVALKTTSQRPAMEGSGSGGFFRRGQVPLTQGEGVVTMF